MIEELLGKWLAFDEEEIGLRNGTGLCERHRKNLYYENQAKTRVHIPPANWVLIIMWISVVPKIESSYGITFSGIWLSSTLQVRNTNL